MSAQSLTLYYAPFTCATIPYVELTEAGATFSVELLDFKRGDHMKPEFLRLNPKHRVPTLIIDGEPLTENVAIQVWIARQFPDAQLLPPSGTIAEARALSLLAWCASGIDPFLTPNVLPQRYCDMPGSEDSVRRCAHKNLHEGLAIAEDLLRGREWFFDRFSAPDVHFFWCFRRATQFQQFNLDLTPYDACRAHFERVSQRPSVRKLFAFEADALAKLEAHS